MRHDKLDIRQKQNYHWFIIFLNPFLFVLDCICKTQQRCECVQLAFPALESHLHHSLSKNNWAVIWMETSIYGEGTHGGYDLWSYLMPNGHGWHQCQADPPLKRPGLSRSLCSCIASLTRPSAAACTWNTPHVIAKGLTVSSSRRVTRSEGWAHGGPDQLCMVLLTVKSPQHGHAANVTARNVKND